MSQNWIDLEFKDSPIAKNDCYVSICFDESSVPKTYTLNLPVYPEEVSNSFKTNYNSVSILGRPGTISNYSNTDDVTTSFTLKLHRELSTLDRNVNSNIGDNIDRIVALIQAAQYPMLNGKTSVPITCYKFGDTLLIGKQTSCNVQWTGPLIDGKYMQCNLSISITNVPKKILEFESVKNSNPRGTGLLEEGTYDYNEFPSGSSSIWN